MSSALGYRSRGRLAVITLPARVDHECVVALRSRIARALGAGSRAIAVDFGAARYVDTRTLSELTVVLRQASQHKLRLAIVGADVRVHWVLALCSIDGLEFHPTVRRVVGTLEGGLSPARRAAWREELRQRRRSARRATLG